MEQRNQTSFSIREVFLMMYPWTWELIWEHLSKTEVTGAKTMVAFHIAQEIDHVLQGRSGDFRRP